MRKLLTVTAVALALGTIFPGLALPAAHAQAAARRWFAEPLRPARLRRPGRSRSDRRWSLSAWCSARRRAPRARTPSPTAPSTTFCAASACRCQASPASRPGTARARQGIGSGFIVSQDGYVLTNAHVVAARMATPKSDSHGHPDRQARVQGQGGRHRPPNRRRPAQARCHRPACGEDRTPDQARVGEWVVAMGSPFGFDNTVTAGIISAKARRLPDETYVPFIQTDVAINLGNLRPLFNLAGEVVGINSQIYSRSGGFMGISFAIPIDVAMNIRTSSSAMAACSAAAGHRHPERRQGPRPILRPHRPRGALVASVEPNAPRTRPDCRRATWCSRSMAAASRTPPSCRA